uniref:Uncharacterized protein n=1 Tax=Steinernema glaseri TaxID=37863 RepID=A0A1I7Z7Q5_9BILA
MLCQELRVSIYEKRNLFCGEYMTPMLAIWKSVSHMMGPGSVSSQCENTRHIAAFEPALCYAMNARQINAILFNIHEENRYD